MNSILWHPKKKKALRSRSFNYDFVLIYIHQTYPAAAVTAGVLLPACSWMLLAPVIKCCLLPLSGAGVFPLPVSSQIASRHAGCLTCKQSWSRCQCRYHTCLSFKVHVSRRSKKISYRHQIGISRMVWCKSSPSLFWLFIFWKRLFTLGHSRSSDAPHLKE